MASNAPISFQFAGLPAEYCFTTPQQFANDIAGGLSGFLPGNFNKIINSDTEPGVDERIDSLWYKTSEGRLYRYDGGWISPHPSTPSGDERRMFLGTEANVWAYDGGDGTNPSVSAPTANTGAMWEVDHDFDFRMPLGPGTSPAPTSTTVAVGATGGVENVTLTKDQLPNYALPTKSIGPDLLTTMWGSPTAGSVFADANVLAGAGGNHPHQAQAWLDGGGLAHSNMSPYKAIFFIKRTARQNYVA